MAAPATPAAASEVHVAIWRAIAGSSVEIPPVNSYVYYFPQGHLEHWSVDASTSGGFERACYHCRVLSVNLLAHPTSDEAFVKYLLQPEEVSVSERAPVRNGDVDRGGENDVAALGKVLTLSDANNGGGFSVPRSCADSVLPQLDFEVEPPFQTLRLRDLHNREYEFRHIYRGTPRRHLLTTGWSGFVNKKRLIAGDSVLFMRRTSTKELYVGIRRSRRIGGNWDWVYGDNSSASYPREPLEAIRNAARGMPFEVVYYPRVGSPDFVVRVKKVLDAFTTNWSPGMRIKMTVEAEDSTQTMGFQGTITSATRPSSGPWCNSPWRMLEVAWNVPEPPFKNINRVNPWDVVYVPAPRLHQAPSPPSKRIRTLQNPGIVIDGARMEDFNFAPMAGSMNFPVLNYPSFSADMQGARQDEMCMPLLLSYQRNNNANQTFTPSLRNDTGPELGIVLALVSSQSPPEGDLSRGQQTGDSISGEDPSNQREDSSPATQRNSVSFQLFGQTIHLQAQEPDSTNNGSETGDGSKEVHNTRNGTNRRS